MQKKQSLKSYAVSLLSFGVAVLATGISHAFTTVGTPVTKTATANLTAAGNVAMTVTVKQVSDNATAANIAWTGVTLPTGWKNADHYIQLDSTITASNGGIRIVTDNTAAGANPVYTSTSATAGGLIDNVDHSRALPMAWSVKDLLAGPTGPSAAKPYDAVTDGAGTANQFQWLYMTDTAYTTLALPQSAAYRTVVNNSGIHFGGNNTEFGAAASPNYVYLEADFSTAVTPRQYSTNRLIVEAFTE